MEPDFWRARWREGRIGFHKGRPNAYLERHAAVLGPAGRVLVPLCGKSEDLAWLAAQGHEVVGVELEIAAARAFFTEHRLVPEETGAGVFTRFAAGGIAILIGDIFDLAAEHVSGVTAFYDRAALIALTPEQRPRYVGHLRRLLPAGTPGLLVSLEYDAQRMPPPPHPVGEPEIRALFAGARVAEIDSGAAQHPRLAELGATGVERCFALVL